MKTSPLALLLLLCLVVLPARAQFGNLKNMVPGAGPVSLDSLLGDVNSGTDFFNKAAMKYALALDPTKKVLEINAGNAAANAKGGVQARAATPELIKKMTEEAKKRKESGEKLSAEAAALVSEGNDEMGKGIAKWALLGVAVAKAKKDGGKDEKLVAAVVAIEEVLKDVPQITALYKAMQALEGEKQKNAN
jgi:hypothetical protein